MHAQALMHIHLIRYFLSSTGKLRAWQHANQGQSVFIVTEICFLLRVLLCLVILVCPNTEPSELFFSTFNCGQKQGTVKYDIKVENLWQIKYGLQSIIQSVQM